VVIPVYNAGSYLDGCLESLAHQRVEASDSFEVVVVDDGSTDDTRDVITRHTAQLGDLAYVHLPRTSSSSRSRARNAGVEQASGELLVFLDGDQFVGPDFVARHLQQHRLHPDPHAVVAGFRTYLEIGRSDIRGFAETGDKSCLGPIIKGDVRVDLLEQLHYLDGDLATAWHLAFSCNVSMHRADFRAAGGWAVEFTGWGLEDSELAYRLYRRGCRIVLDPANVVYHQGVAIQSYGDLYGNWLRNLDCFMRRHDYAMEVVLQNILGEFFDPTRTGNWLECYERFELTVRLTQGQLPARAIA